MNQSVALYLHIPFCKQKCLYCDFCSFTSTEEEQDAYVSLLIEEMQLYSRQFGTQPVRTIFIGGGTPSVLSMENMERIVKAIHGNFDARDLVEFSIESNPGTVTLDKLLGYQRMGIDRISMGLQATQDSLLKKLGRIHSYETFLESYQLIRDAGFDNVNVDLMYGLPDQTEADWKVTLERIVALQPEHISAYSLKVEEGTPFDRMEQEGKLKLPTEEMDRRNHHMAIDFLKQHGYEHYEISNFSKAGRACQHNLVYWHNEEYIGLGLGAHGYMKGIRYGNAVDLAVYETSIKEGILPWQEQESIDLKDAMFETIMLELRLVKGLSLLAFKERFGYYLHDLVGEELQKCKAEGLLLETDEHLYFTELGMDISNTVLVRILEAFEKNTTVS